MKPGLRSPARSTDAFPVPMDARNQPGHPLIQEKNRRAHPGLSTLVLFLTLAFWPGFLYAGPGGFDNDGYDDLAVGAPYENIGAIEDAGAVNVLYGTATNGLSASGDQIWYQDVTGVAGSCQEADVFGKALAAGDFNGDGFLDLAVGVPGEKAGGVDHAGAVNILYGAGAGLTSTGDQMWYQSAGIAGEPELNDRFGEALAVGDFNGDGYDDLAIGASGEDVGTIGDAGAVSVIYGSSFGLTGTGDQYWHQDVPGVQNAAEEGDWFGMALAAGDFDQDGYDDLAVGVPGEDDGDTADTGAVHVFYGSSGGLTTVYDWCIFQGSIGSLDPSEEYDGFGGALAAGDFNGDRYVDLAIGAPGEDVGTINDAGAVSVIFGSFNGFTSTSGQFWHQNVAGTQNGAENGDGFGRPLAAGDFNGDGYADLAVGIPYENNGDTTDTGAVHVFYGASDGLTAVDDWWFVQNSAGMQDSAEAYDRFGWALASGDFNGDGYAELAIGVPYEDVGTIEDAGAVSVVFGSPFGLTTTGNQFWHQNVSYIEGACEEADLFGYALASIPRVHRKQEPVPVGAYQLLLLGN